ncbi:MAG: LapA family protein [Rhizomicrobium sp.]
MRLSTYLIALPVILIAALIAVANRGDVVVSLDPFSRGNPAIAFEMPLYLALFVVFGLGILLGAAVAAIGRFRKRD